MDDLVSTEWLADRLGEPGLKVIDASAHLPDAGRDARGEFEAAHIPGARFLDLDTLKDLDSPVPAALPTAEQFAVRMAELGVRDGDRVVIYDDSGVKTSARAWFIFRLHGLRAAFAEAGIDLDRPVVTTCGSGVTAAVLLFALHLLGKVDVALYDGSWSEWGADPATPKATGPAA